MLSIEEALEEILGTIVPLPAETVALHEAHSRILREGISSLMDLPPFDNSAMDGYAVRAEDVATAASDRPVTLRLIGTVAAGGCFSGEIRSDECVRVFTGSPLPSGADAVMMQEDTRAEADRVFFLNSAKPWEHVRFRGEDIKAGAVVAEPGKPLTSGLIGLLAATGMRDIAVGRRPSVALLATGSELREPGQALTAGRIYESNRAMLAGPVIRAGGLPRMRPLVPDTLEATVDAMTTALGDSDAVITTGGVSVGEFDFVKAAWEQLHGKLEFWKVAIKPGKPFVFGRGGGKFLFGLPGNPVSALVTFWLLVRPALMRLQGAADVTAPTSRGFLVEALVNRGDRRHFMRAQVNDATGEVRPAGIQASHIISGLARANGLVEVPPQTKMEAGTVVQVLRID